LRILPGAFALVLVAFLSASCDSSDPGNAPGTQTPTPGNGAPVVDLSRLPLGDGRVSELAEIGAVYSCDPVPATAGEPRPWFNGDGTWDFTIKPVIAGEVLWEADSRIVLAQDVRRIVTNSLPAHPTGEFPVSPEDPAFEVDPNPHSIASRDIQVEVPVLPRVLVEPKCLSPGLIGVLLSGAPLYGPLDEQGRDAMAYPLLDACEGNVHQNGVYHYHAVSTCVDDEWRGGHSRLVGYALDGFGIYGHYDVDGTVLTNDDLDPCHGHTHEIEWDGEPRVMYHYHATWEYPYVVGCFRGEPVDTSALGLD
jgi:hypothetical protein